MLCTILLLPRPLCNDPRFIQFTYRYSHASTRFVEVEWVRYVISYKYQPNGDHIFHVIYTVVDKYGTIANLVYSTSKETHQSFLLGIMETRSQK